MKSLAGIFLALTLASTAIAQDVNLNDVPESAGGKAKIEAADASPHPIISNDSSWATEVVIVIAGMFVAAMLVGSVVKLPTPAVDAHSHDDHSHGAHGHDDHSHDSHGHSDQAHGH